jgi:bifunctional DNA-binding transcriptional regulator/antitoxin component of YhaV-PrlF toxin-antitoxin module
MGKAFNAKVAAPNGRLVLPKMVREALCLSDGEAVVFFAADGEVKLTSLDQRIKRGKGQYRKYETSDLTVDDFIAERRDEAARQDGV